MALTPPSSLSPSKMTTFTNCALAFRFVYVESLAEQPTVAATRGTLVHRALEHLMGLPPAERTVDAAAGCLDRAVADLRPDPEWTGLALDDAAEATMIAEAESLLASYFRLEDPTTVEHVGLELPVETTIGGVHVRGIVDRLDVVDGDLVVTDYKTGRSPSDRNVRSRMFGVHLYALLVERTFGRRPKRVQLLHLAEPEAVIASPTTQTTKAVERRVEAVWDAVATRCEQDDFSPNPGIHCDWCSFTEWCPAWGGDPGRAAVDVEIATKSAAGQDPLLIV